MDLAWKIVGIIAALLLAAAGVFSYLGKDAVKNEITLADRAEANLKDTRLRAQEADDSLKENTGAFNQAETDRDLAKKGVEETNAEEAEYVAEIADTKLELDDVKKKVADIKQKVADVGNIKALIAKIEGIKNDVTEAENQIVNRDQKLKIAVEKVEAVKSEIDEYSDLERRQLKAIISPEFRANVAQVHPRWGFVLLNKGNRDGVYTNGDLEIERGGVAIGRLKVSRVEQDQAVAAMVADTWAEGLMPQPGDVVVAVAEEESAAGEGEGADGADLPVIDPAAPPAPPAEMGSDPFGGGAPEPVPGSDPFGAGAPAEAPAPAGGDAPAAPANDPFGGF